MSESARFILATFCGIVLAALVHIAIVFGMPMLSEQDAFSRITMMTGGERAELIAAPGGQHTWLPQPDPTTAVAACAYNLENGPIRVSAKTGALFQSLSFHTRGGGIFFAVTDRAAIRGGLDLVVMTRRQLDEILAAEDEEEPSRDVRIVSPKHEGIVVVRVLAPLPSLHAQAEEVAKSVTCAVEPY